MTPRCFAVVHVVNRDQAVRNTEVAVQLGFDGVFLISHGLLDWYDLIRVAWPCSLICPYVGVNFLDIEPVEEAVSVAADHRLHGAVSRGRFSAVWTDPTYMGPRPVGVEVFSGFAFKGQPQRALADARLVQSFCDVLVTSGSATGIGAPIEKVQALREVLGPEKRLGLASGVTPENIGQYMAAGATDFLVATSINYPGTDKIDPARGRQLVDAFRGSSPA